MQTNQRARAALATTWAIAWRTLVFFVLWSLLLGPAVIAWVQLGQPEQQSPAGTRFYFDCVGLLSILGAGALMVRGVDRGASLGFGWGPRAGADVWHGVVGGVAWMGVSLGVIALGGGVEFAPRGTFAGPALLLAAVSGVFNAALQEIAVRSYLFQMVRQRAGPVWAILVSSAFFVAMHVGAFKGAVLPAVNVFAASLLFSLVLLRTGSLWAVIGVHFAWNFLVGPVLGLAVSGRDLADGWQVLGLHGPDWLTGGSFGIEGSVVVTIVTLVACGVVRRGWADPPTLILKAR